MKSALMSNISLNIVNEIGTVFHFLALYFLSQSELRNFFMDIIFDLATVDCPPSWIIQDICMFVML